MTKGMPNKEEADQERSRAENATERRFNETVQNLLNTPHKPHRKNREAGACKENRGTRERPPAPRSGEKVKKHGEC